MTGIQGRKGDTGLPGVRGATGVVRAGVVEIISSSVCLSFFLFRGGTRCLRMPALRPASQAGKMRNPEEATSVVCSCCATSPYREV